jgi:hypothetical protein
VEQLDQLAATVQGLQIGSSNPFRDPALTASNYNPFRRNVTGAANPVLDPHHRSASARPSRRETSGYDSGGYSTNGGGGFLAPGQNPLQNPDRRSSGRRSATPAVTSSQERHGFSQRRPSSAQSRPRENGRENGTRSAFGFGSSRSSAQALVLPTTAYNGMKLTRSIIKIKFTARI